MADQGTNLPIRMGKDLLGLSSPIGIIGMFGGLSEVAMVFAATRTDDDIQMIMTLFSVLFPVLLACLFFYVLWHRPGNLYPPREFKGGASVDEYFKGTGGYSSRLSPDDTIAAFKTSITEILTSQATTQSVVAALSGDVTEPQLKEVTDAVTMALQETAERIEQSASIYIYTFRNPASLGITNIIQIIATPEMTVVDLLNRVALYTKLQKSGYGSQWVLRDVETFKQLKIFGSDSGDTLHATTVGDTRTLDEAGITPGMALLVDDQNLEYDQVKMWLKPEIEWIRGLKSKMIPKKEM